MDVYPGDKIVIDKAVLWLGAAAVFYLPMLVIPLRSVENQRGRARMVPRGRLRLVRRGLDQDSSSVRQGPVLLRLLHRQLLHESGPRPRLRRLLREPAKAGAASASTSTPSTTTWPEASRPTPRAAGTGKLLAITSASNFQYSYQSNYGPLISIPPNETLSEAIVHQTAQTSQNYSVSHTLGRRAVEQQQLHLYRYAPVQSKPQPDHHLQYQRTATRASAASTTFSNQSEFDYLHAVHDRGRRLSSSSSTRPIRCRRSASTRFPNSKCGRPTSFRTSSFRSRPTLPPASTAIRPARASRKASLPGAATRISSPVRSKQRCSAATSRAPSPSTNMPTAPAISKPRSSKT